MELLSRHRIFQTDDLDAGVQFASSIWERNKTHVTEGKYGLRWNHVELNRSSLSQIGFDCSADLSVEGTLSDHFRVHFHQSGSISHIVNGRRLTADPRRPMVHVPGIDMRLGLRPFELLMVSLEGDFVRSAMAQRFRRLPPVESWAGALPPTGRRDTLQSTVTWLAREIDRPDSPLTRPGKPRLHAERLLVSLFAECLSDRICEGAEPIPDIGEAQVRRAMEWIDAHLCDPIGVEEIATELGVGVRSLQCSFRRVRGASPHEAITMRRLEGARTALLKAEPRETVTKIAAEFCFFELGRFSKRYRERFGETPSQTLARGAGSSVA
ncbi:MAG: transcriptional regulator protein [Hyphomicrobiales bacterium]|nr:transcriptional regulator protein [Hyphomicrobiales bacterium]